MRIFFAPGFEANDIVREYRVLGSKPASKKIFGTHSIRDAAPMKIPRFFDEGVKSGGERSQQSDCRNTEFLWPFSVVITSIITFRKKLSSG